MPTNLDVFQKVLDGVQKALTTYAPVAWKAAQDVTRLDCIGQICFGFGALIIAAILAPCVALLARQVSKYLNEDQEAMGFACLVGAVVGGMLACVLLIIGICQLLDFWAWAGMFRPDLYLIHEAMQKAFK